MILSSLKTYELLDMLLHQHNPSNFREVISYLPSSVGEKSSVPSETVPLNPDLKYIWVY